VFLSVYKLDFMTDKEYFAESNDNNFGKLIQISSFSFLLLSESFCMVPIKASKFDFGLYPRRGL
jgi:hypothetical protein